jgi:hypothetical protein
MCVTDFQLNFILITLVIICLILLWFLSVAYRDYRDDKRHYDKLFPKPKKDKNYGNN